jgi:lipoprotein-releasing system permease protein
MALPYEAHLAMRNLTRHPWRTAAMIFGLALAVLVMAYIPSTMASFYDDLIDKAVEQTSAHVTVWPPERRPGRVRRAVRVALGGEAVVVLEDHTFPRARDLNGWHALVRRVAETPGVVAAAGFVRGDATVSRGRLDMGIVLEGVQPHQYARVVSIAKHFPARQVPALGPSDVAIGFRMADKLGVYAGEHIHVGTARARRKMRVRAIFRSGYYDKDLHHAYVPLSTAQRMFRMGNEISGIAARCDRLAAAPAVSAALRRRMTQKVRNWRDDNASLLSEIATVRRVTLFINVLLAVVVSVGMANVFTMFVLSRQKELAILRAVGASRGSLRGILLLEAMAIWLVGTVIGLTGVLGVMAFEQTHPFPVSQETYGIAFYATEPKAWALTLTVALAAGTMAASAWWSGRRAVRLRPVEVIFGR